jgi:hypothetical protein
MGAVHHMNKFESLPKDDLCYGWLNLASGSEKEIEDTKVYRQTDDGQRAIRIADLSFQPR